MLSLLYLTASLASATPVVVEPDIARQYPGFAGKLTDRFEVLDIHFAKGVVAFKHIAHPDGSEHEAVSCNYAGMTGDLRFSGVLLGTWSLKTNKPIKTFVIYKPTYEPSDCMPHEASEKELQAAKTHFLEEGLDIAKRPPSLPLKEGSFRVNGLTGNYRIERLSEEASNQRGYTTEGVADMTGVNKLGVSITGEPVYASYAEFGLAGAGSLTTSVEGLWADDTHFFVLEKHAFGSMRGGSEHFSFSPLLTYPK
jgi:hypothetical protein